MVSGRGFQGREISHVCNDPVSSCSSAMFEKGRACKLIDGRANQALDGQAQERISAGDHPRQDDGSLSKQGVRPADLGDRKPDGRWQARHVKQSALRANHKDAREARAPAQRPAGGLRQGDAVAERTKKIAVPGREKK
jgi:hypothetical protein